MTQNSDNRAIHLDPAKLLGFRQLILCRPEGDGTETERLRVDVLDRAFNKVGVEVAPGVVDMPADASLVRGLDRAFNKVGEEVPQ